MTERMSKALRKVVLEDVCSGRLLLLLELVGTGAPEQQQRKSVVRDTHVTKQ